MFKVGERVIKNDQRGTVVAVQDTYVNVIWDSGVAEVANATDLQTVGVQR